jgi:hypothetical protein
MYLFEKMFNAPRVKDPKPKELTQNEFVEEYIKQLKVLMNFMLF